MRKYLLNFISIVILFITTFSSASATEFDINGYDINGDGLTDYSDFNIIKTELLDAKNDSNYSISDLVCLERALQNQITYESDLEVYEIPDEGLIKPACAYKLSTVSDKNDALIKDIFENYDFISFDMKYHTLQFENEEMEVSLIFESTYCNTNTYHDVASSHIIDEPDFVVTVISDGSYYYLTAVR